jgi:hypothetical protein
MESCSRKAGVLHAQAPGLEMNPVWVDWVRLRVQGGTCPCSHLPGLSPDVDECAWDTHLCQEGQRCVNLLGSYHCLPDCEPGFRVAADGAGCEGDKGTGWGQTKLLRT